MAGIFILYIYNSKKNTKFWETYFGMRGGEKALQCIICFVCFVVCVFLQIADSRWLTLQWNSQWNRKKGRSWWGGAYIYIYIYIHIYTYWLVVSNIFLFFQFSIYLEFHDPNWRAPSFFRGVGQPPTSKNLSLYHLDISHWINMNIFH